MTALQEGTTRPLCPAALEICQKVHTMAMKNRLCGPCECFPLEEALCVAPTVHRVVFPVDAPQCSMWVYAL